MSSTPQEPEVRSYAQATEKETVQVPRSSQETPDVHRPSVVRRRQEENRGPVRRPRANSHASQETTPEYQNFRLLSRHDTWTTANDASQLRLNRNYSATLLFNRQVDLSAADIISALAARDFNSDYVKALQRSSPGIYIITFHDLQDKESFLELTNFKVNGFAPLLQDSTAPLTFVNIRNAPPELPDAAIIARLKCYGDVITFRRCTHYDSSIENGIRTARMRLRSPIPSYIRIASESLLILYANQPRTCRKCNLPGHEARSCNTFACFNCDAIGHLASSCTERTRCSICKSTAHRASSCPYAIIDDLDTALPISTVLAEALSAVPVVPTASTSAATSDAEQEHDISDAQSLAAKTPDPATRPSNSDNSNGSTIKSLDLSSFQFNSAAVQLPFLIPPKQPPKPAQELPAMKETTSKFATPQPVIKEKLPVPLPPAPQPQPDDSEDNMSFCSASSKRKIRPEDPDSDGDDYTPGGNRRKTRPKRPPSGKLKNKDRIADHPRWK